MERKRTLQPENRSLSYFTVSFNTLMFGTVKKGFGKLVAWLDWPPPKPRAGLNDVHWEFLGDLLGELTATTDRETACLMRTNLSDPDNVRALAECWIRPAWQRLTPSSREKIRHTLDFYLTGDSGKIDRPSRFRSTSVLPGIFSASSGKPCSARRRRLRSTPHVIVKTTTRASSTRFTPTGTQKVTPKTAMPIFLFAKA